MKTESYIKLGRLIALISFILGTIIFGLYFQSSLDELLFVGYGFIVFTGIINIILLISILIRASIEKDNRKKLLTTCGLMLLNIPIMLLYCWIAFIIIGYMRITFTNTMPTTLTDINIIGCETEHIDKLEIGESKTVWIGITGDCTINIDYLENGKRKEEIVVGYVTSGMGQRIKHNVGGQNKETF